MLALAGHDPESRVPRCQLTETLPRVRADRVHQQARLDHEWRRGQTGSGSTRALSLESGLTNLAACWLFLRLGAVSVQLDRLPPSFFTTKANGMGMGLPIIAHHFIERGGRLWATANSPYGLCFVYAAAGESPS